MIDLISRQAAIEELHTCQTYLFDSKDPDKKIILEVAENAIQQLPSAEPVRHGKWLSDDIDGHVRCSSCNKRYDWTSQAQYYEFCPSCGVKMDEDDEGDSK